MRGREGGRDISGISSSFLTNLFIDDLILGVHVVAIREANASATFSFP